jgi:hypothetical protein
MLWISAPNLVPKSNLLLPSAEKVSVQGRGATLRSVAGGANGLRLAYGARWRLECRPSLERSPPRTVTAKAAAGFEIGDGSRKVDRDTQALA